MILTYHFGLDFTNFLGPFLCEWLSVPSWWLRGAISMPCRQLCVFFQQSCTDWKCQNLVQRWSNFIGKEWFCLPSSFCSDMQGNAFCLELTGAYKKADWIYIFFNYRFESSSHAISMSAYLREQRRELYSRSGELQGMKIDSVKVWIILFCRNWVSHPCYIKELIPLQFAMWLV